MIYRIALIACFASVAFASRAGKADVPSAEQFRQVAELCHPAHAESIWATIPWMTDLWQARVKAAAEGKPILLWEMDGHPLGCT